MDTIAIDLQAEEAERSLRPVSHLLKGLSHLLKPQDVVALIRRRELLEEVIRSAVGSRDAIGALLGDGYPDLPSLEVDGDVLEDIDENIEGVLTARSAFTARQETVSGTFGPVGKEHAPRGSMKRRA